MALFLAHTALLVWSAYASTRGLVRATIDRLLATFLLAWTNLVITSLLLASLGHLGQPGWFFRTSLLLALGTWLLLRRLPAPPDPIAPPDRRPFDWRIVAACALTLLPIAYASIRIAATYAPNNYDSMTYHLPRVMYYLGQNDLAHFDTGNDRQIYFPFNFNLLQLFALIYSPPLQCVNFINLLTWGVAGLAVFRLARLHGLSANAALLAAWIALTSTQILAQATATTNDLPTGAVLLCVLVFVLRWRQTRRRSDALLTGLAAGLTAGAKLTILFFGPTAALIVLGLAWQHWQRRQLPAFFAGVRAWIIPGLIALALASPFALINLAEKGEWINKTYDFTLNRPFSVASVVQTSQAYLVQLFIEPLHRFSHDLTFTGQLNAWGQRTFFPQWNEAYAFSPLYLFPPDLNEDHVWFGFAGPFIVLCAAFCLLRPRPRPVPVMWLAALGLGWFATYFTLNKWSLYNQRYFVLAILVLSPCVAAAVDAAWSRPGLRRTARNVLALLALSSVWLAAIYLFLNTSRPYAPLWAGEPPPPALPTLPTVMEGRMRTQPLVNIDSTDGNERIFLLMAQSRHQRFTARAHVVPDAYNVFSHWGLVRKVAYSNIEQLSSYTIVDVPSKRTAGVEYLGKIGTGGAALDYYGLVPHADEIAAGGDDRKVLVALYYGPREPGRYAKMRARVAGLNPSDHARLTLGVDYDDGTSAELANFTATGEAPAPVTKPFRRFTIKVTDQTTGDPLGAVSIPYLFRDQPADFEAPDDPALIFAQELVGPAQTNFTTSGLASPEGPYPQWDLPVFRWAKAPSVKLNLPATPDLARLELSFSLRLHARDHASIDVLLNGVLVKNYTVTDRVSWLYDTLSLAAGPGPNVIEFRNVAVGTETDWIDYVERHPDVKNYLVSTNTPFEAGAQAHYASHGQRENRQLNLKRQIVEIASPDPLYYAFRQLRVDGFRQP